MNNANDNPERMKPDIRKSNASPPLLENASSMDKLTYWLGVGLGSGLPKKAPGTWGSLAGLLLAIPMMMLGFIPFVSITIIASVAGIWLCERTSKLMGGHDNPHIVWDEWAGMWIALLPFCYFLGDFDNYNAANMPILLILLANSFVLFRIFDIFKPFPISYIDEKISGGLGIMLDDLVAGAITAIIMVVFLGMLGAILFADIST